MRLTGRVREILGYDGERPGVKANLARLLMHGLPGGSGKLVILPVDQGFEHGPARTFSSNPAAYDPRYVFDYIERFYNPKRRHSTIGYLSPGV